MTTQVVGLNGKSGSGKTGIARCLQLPPSLMRSGSGVAFGPQGEDTHGWGFRGVEAACRGPYFLGDSSTVVAVNSFGLAPSCTGAHFSYRLDTPEANTFLCRFADWGVVLPSGSA